MSKGMEDLRRKAEEEVKERRKAEEENEEMRLEINRLKEGKGKGKAPDKLRAVVWNGELITPLSTKERVQHK